MTQSETINPFEMETNRPAIRRALARARVRQADGAERLYIVPGVGGRFLVEDEPPTDGRFYLQVEPDGELSLAQARPDLRYRNFVDFVLDGVLVPSETQARDEPLRYENATAELKRERITFVLPLLRGQMLEAARYATYWPAPETLLAEMTSTLASDELDACRSACLNAADWVDAARQLKQVSDRTPAN